MMTGKGMAEWFSIELPVVDYQEVWDLQRLLVTARKEGPLDRDVVILTEHPPVYTVGRRGGMQDLRVTEDFLRTKGISVIRIERGGNITFHGPGQIVMYPIIDLRRAGMGVADLIERLEGIMLRAAADYGLTATRNPLNRGVWVGQRKLGSVGIAIRRGISFHGASLNVTNSLEPFSWINPCGLKGIEMTSIAQEISGTVRMEEVRKDVRRHTEGIFGVALREMRMARGQVLNYQFLLRK
ncbi:MAG: lipoyl(octanoyl) transferase LipB [bacterium]